MITVAPYKVELVVTVKDREPYVARCNGCTASSTSSAKYAVEHAAGKHFAKVCGQFGWNPEAFTITTGDGVGPFGSKKIFNVVYTPKQ